MNIEEMYKHFGPEVLQEIRSHVALHGSVTNILKQINIPSGPSAESQHVALRNFIYQYGVAFFLSTVQSKLNSEDIDRMKTRRLMQLSRQERRQGSKAYKSTDEMKHEVEFEHTGKLPPGADPGPRPKQGTPLRRKSDSVWKDTEAAPPPDQPAETAPAPAKTGSSPYNGPERRKASERRQTTTERRTDLQVVFKNRRYGGDRRKQIRRRADREKAMKN